MNNLINEDEFKVYGYGDRYEIDFYNKVSLNIDNTGIKGVTIPKNKVFYFDELEMRDCYATHSAVEKQLKKYGLSVVEGKMSFLFREYYVFEITPTPFNISKEYIANALNIPTKRVHTIGNGKIYVINTLIKKVD